MTLMRLLPIVILAWTLLLGACGDGGGESGVETTPTPAVRVVTSDDGKLTLEIPLEALDDPEMEISATAVPLDALPEEMQLVQGAETGYRLEPDGLEFSEPVAVTLELDRAEIDEEPASQQTAYALVSSTGDGELEVLPEQATEWMLGEDTVLVKGELNHFSWITKTKGSLVASIEEVPRFHPVGSTFTAQGSVGNGSSSRRPVTMESAGGEFLAFGTVSATGTTSFGGNATLASGDAVRATGTFQCGSTPGLGTYTLRGRATSVAVVDDGRLETPLRVTVDGVVECVAATPTPAPPTATPTPGEDTAVTQVAVAQSPGCEHTQPGVQSEAQSWVSVLPVDGFSVGFDAIQLQSATVDASAAGPGLLQPTASTQLDANGRGLLTFPIDQFGTYEIVINGVTGPDGPLDIVEGSQIGTSFDVGDVCTPPGQPPSGDPTCGQEPGDVDGDGDVDLDDALLVTSFVGGHIDALPCANAGDVTGNGQVAIDDAVVIAQNALGIAD